MNRGSDISRSLQGLKARLDYVNRAWTVDNYESLLRFYVDMAPKVLDAERCAIFIVDRESGRVLSKVGTGLEDWAIEAPLEGSVVGRAITTGQCIIENEPAPRTGFHRTADAQTGFVTHNMICAPIRSVAGERTTGALEVLNKRQGGFTEEDVALITQLADFLSMALDNILLNEEILNLSSQLDREVAHLRSAYLGDVPFIAESEAMRNVLNQVRMVSETPVNVLIEGENGTGKEVIARMIHDGGVRAMRSFVAVNCAAIPEALMESEFFGYEKGAFTGAASSRGGRFEEANGGTLFLDEVSDMPMTMQPKFLRAVQEGEGSRLGSNQVTRYDLRIISASNRDLRASVAAGTFREDLFYRLYAVEIAVPPLRARRDDIAPLAQAFLDDVCRRFGKVSPGFSNELLAAFEAYAWPGNVRQLRREVERLVALTPEGTRLTPEHCSPALRDGGELPLDGPGEETLPERVRRLEIQLIRGALQQTRGNKARAARMLGITRQGLHKKLGRYGLDITDDEV